MKKNIMFKGSQQLYKINLNSVLNLKDTLTGQEAMLVIKWAWQIH